MGRLRVRARKRFRIEQERAALRHTQSLMRKCSDPQLELEIWGEQNAQAYMQVGWHPESQGWEGKVPVYHLKIDRWESLDRSP